MTVQVIDCNQALLQSDLLTDWSNIYSVVLTIWSSVIIEDEIEIEILEADVDTLSGTYLLTPSNIGQADAFKEDVYSLQFKVQYDSGTIAIDKGCKFFDCEDMGCIIASKVGDEPDMQSQLDYFILKEVNCPCDCESLMNIYTRLKENLKDCKCQ